MSSIEEVFKNVDVVWLKDTDTLQILDQEGKLLELLYVMEED